jgi:hypothetical protein
VFCASLVNALRKAFREKSTAYLWVALVLLLIGCGFAIHSIVKFRPYLSVPVLGYRCTTSIMSVTVLLAMGLHRAESWLGKRGQAVIVAVVWSLVFYAGLTRPHYLSHLSVQVGLERYHDPAANLRKLLRIPQDSSLRKDKSDREHGMSKTFD